MKTKHMLRASDKLWKEITLYKINNNFKSVNDVIIYLIRKGLKQK